MSTFQFRTEKIEDPFISYLQNKNPERCSGFYSIIVLKFYTILFRLRSTSVRKTFLNLK